MPITSKIVPHGIGILFIYRHAELSSQHLINTPFSWVLLFVLVVFPFPYSSSFVILCFITGMSFGAGSGSSYHSGNGFGVGSPLRHSSSSKGGFLGPSANERPVDYVEKDPKGRYVRVIYFLYFFFFIDIWTFLWSKLRKWVYNDLVWNQSSVLVLFYNLYQVAKLFPFFRFWLISRRSNWSPLSSLLDKLSYRNVTFQQHSHLNLKGISQISWFEALPGSFYFWWARA